MASELLALAILLMDLLGLGIEVIYNRSILLIENNEIMQLK